MEAAIDRHSDKLDAQQFGKMLDVYDQENWLSLSSIVVPKPLEMIQKLKARREKQEKAAQKENATETGLRESCDFLNDLIKELRT